MYACVFEQGPLKSLWSASKGNRQGGKEKAYDRRSGRKSNHVQVEQQTALYRSNESLMRASIRREAGSSDEKKGRKMEV